MPRSFELEERTRRFALRIVKLYRSAPASGEAQVIARQLLRSGTSVGANYRSAQRARSTAELSSKLGIVIEEADETAFWLQLLVDANIMPAERLSDLQRECNELTAIFVRSTQTLRKQKQSKSTQAKEE